MAGHLIRRLHQQSTQVFLAQTQPAGVDLASVQFAPPDAIGQPPGRDQARLAAAGNAWSQLCVERTKALAVGQSLGREAPLKSSLETARAALTRRVESLEAQVVAPPAPADRPAPRRKRPPAE